MVEHSAFNRVVAGSSPAERTNLIKQMSQYPLCSECGLDIRISDLESLCLELKNALKDANEEDSVAEGYNSANFRHKRQEFDELIARAERALLNI